MTDRLHPKPLELMTVRRLAARLHIPPHRIEYLLRTRRHLKASDTVGRTRIFDSNMTAQICRSLPSMDAKRGTGDA